LGRNFPFFLKILTGPNCQILVSGTLQQDGYIGVDYAWAVIKDGHDYPEGDVGMDQELYYPAYLKLA
jgi:hypothetical protein